MERTFICTLILVSFFGAFSKYVYIKEAKTWSAAQLYCQQEYTDLAPISNSYDIKRMQVAGNTGSFSWIGPKNISGTEKCMWWRGGRISWVFWAQTTHPSEESSNGPPNFRLSDFSEITIPFFCYNAIVVMKKKTWEDAWQYCSDNHNMLASVASKMEMQLIQRELNRAGITQRVWIGLHFFPGDGWLWVDNQPVDYESWSSGVKPSCPRVNLECAALKVNGWIDPTAVVDLSPIGGDGAAGLEENVWEAHDCEEKLHFVCY